MFPHLYFFPWSSCPQASPATWINLALLRDFCWLGSMTVECLAAPQKEFGAGYPHLEVSSGSGDYCITCIIGHLSHLRPTSLRTNKFVFLEAEVLHSRFWRSDPLVPLPCFFSCPEQPVTTALIYHGHFPLGLRRQLIKASQLSSPGAGSQVPLPGSSRVKCT